MTTPNMTPMAQWIRIGKFSDIERQSSRVIDTPEGRVALFKTAKDEIFAIEDRCPHKGGPLSEGLVHGNTVTCPLHDWNVDLCSGEALYPDKGCVKRFPLKVQGDEIHIFMEMGHRADAEHEAVHAL